jgi:hypothetical protein
MPKYQPDSKTLMVSPGIIRKLGVLVDDKKKIAAIKLLRGETNCGLREAKEAIEKRFCGHKSISAFDIRGLASVKSIVIDFGDGDVSLSLADLQMMTLVNMTSIGIEETRRILDLYDILAKWEGVGDE